MCLDRLLECNVPPGRNTIRTENEILTSTGCQQIPQTLPVLMVAFAKILLATGGIPGYLLVFQTNSDHGDAIERLTEP